MTEENNELAPRILWPLRISAHGRHLPSSRGILEAGHETMARFQQHRRRLGTHGLLAADA